MTSTKNSKTISKQEVEELTNLINNNLKTLNIGQKESKENKIAKKLEKKISSYIEQDKTLRKKNIALSKEYATKVAKAIVKHAKYPIITTSIIYTESKFNRKAVNKASGATGLGQIHPIHREELINAGIITTFSDLHKVENNVKAINFVLCQKLKITNGDMKKALKLYSGNASNYNSKIWKKVESIKTFKKIL